MGLHVFHDPVLIKLATSVSSKVNPRFQKNLEKIIRAVAGQTARNTPKFDRGIPRDALIPFGLGPRVWIGRASQSQEIPAVPATILPMFSFPPDRCALGRAAGTHHAPPAGRDANDRDAAVSGMPVGTKQRPASSLRRPAPASVSPIGGQFRFRPECLKSVVGGTHRPEMTLPAGCCRLASLSFTTVILTVRFGGREGHFQAFVRSSL
jgi:hypothetical protein